MITNHLIDQYVNKLNYLVYDDKCLVCNICAKICKCLFPSTFFISFTTFDRHWSMFPSVLNKIDRGTINLFSYSNDKWVYGDEAIELICIINEQPIRIWSMLYRLATKMRKKCNKCKLSES